MADRRRTKVQPWRAGLFHLGQFLRDKADGEQDVVHRYRLKGGAVVGCYRSGGRYRFLVYRRPQATGTKRLKWLRELKVFAKHFALDPEQAWEDVDTPGHDASVAAYEIPINYNTRQPHEPKEEAGPAEAGPPEAVAAPVLRDRPGPAESGDG